MRPLLQYPLIFIQFPPHMYNTHPKTTDFVEQTTPQLLQILLTFIITFTNSLFITEM